MGYGALSTTFTPEGGEPLSGVQPALAFQVGAAYAITENLAIALLYDRTSSTQELELAEPKAKGTLSTALSGIAAGIVFTPRTAYDLQLYGAVGSYTVTGRSDGTAEVIPGPGEDPVQARSVIELTTPSRLGWLLGGRIRVPLSRGLLLTAGLAYRQAADFDRASITARTDEDGDGDFDQEDSGTLENFVLDTRSWSVTAGIAYQF